MRQVIATCSLKIHKHTHRVLDALAAEAVPALRDAGLRLALLTKTTSRTRAWIAGTLADAGFPVGPGDDVEADVVTGQAAGLTGVLVRTA